jgi:transglutaminase-like putative cysteine protease
VDLPAPQSQGPLINYDVTLEPHGQRWLLALDMPIEVPEGSYRAAGFVLIYRKPIMDRMLYKVASAPDYRIQPRLWPRIRVQSLQLPQGLNPRTRELAERWRSEEPDDAAIARRALRLFQEQEFTYTLNPPLLGIHSVDDFLFETRKGFCEHYASAFTMLMRAAGVPSRVVTGYQGGELNQAGDYYIIRQSDAHAWSEIWLENLGWVRIDPTSVIVPARIELGLAAALSPAERASLPFAARRDRNPLYQLQLRWDRINAGWNRWILAYGPELQQQFLSRFGLPDWYRMTLALTVVIVTFLTVLGIVLLWQARPVTSSDPYLKLWQAFCRRLEKLNLARLPYEGPRDFAERASRTRPDLAEEIAAVSDMYISLRYAGVNDPTLAKSFALRVRRFRS